MRRPTLLLLGAAALTTAGCSPLLASFDFGGDEPTTFVTSVAAGEPQRAYDLLCPATRFGVPFESFRNAVEHNGFLLAATGVTTGSLLSGVKFRKDNVIETETVVMRSVTGTVRTIKAEHRQLEKFHLD